MFFKRQTVLEWACRRLLVQFVEIYEHLDLEHIVRRIISAGCIAKHNNFRKIRHIAYSVLEIQNFTAL